MRIPKEIEQKVVRALYAEADSIDWGTLTPQQRSRQYAKWVESVEVGEPLRQYLSDAETRVWIKDGPMKEWRRSKNGIGKYALFFDEPENVPTRIVRTILGRNWTVVPSSVRSKPLRLTAQGDQEEVVIVWGESKDLKHLMWSALSASAEGDARKWIVCVVFSFTRPIPSNERLAQSRLAKRCQLRLEHVSL